MKRRGAEIDATAGAAPPAERLAMPSSSSIDTTAHSPFAQRRAAPHSREEAEERYIAARDAWTAAMRAASSGRPADLAALALAQESYEVAAAERERWLSGGRAAIPIEPDSSRVNLEAVVGNELQWRRIHAPRDEAKGLLGRLKRRVTGR